MNSMKKTVAFLSFAMLLIPFFTATSVRAKYYVINFTNSFKTIGGTYSVDIKFTKNMYFDFHFSINNGAITAITGRNAAGVKLNPDQTLNIDVTWAIKHLSMLAVFEVTPVGAIIGAAESAFHHQITITGLDGVLKGAKAEVKVSNVLEVGGSVDIFTIDANAAAKTIKISETTKK